MCEPITVGTAATSFLTASAGMVTTAATTGLLGAGGAFSLGAGSLFGGASFGSAVSAANVFSLGSTFSTFSNVFGAFNALAGAGQNAANYEYQGRMAEYRAAIDNNNALAARYSADYDRQMFQDKYKRSVLAKQAPGWAISGVVGTTGTPLMVAQESFMEGLREEAAIDYGGNVAVAANRQNAIGQRFAASNLKASASRERIGGVFGAGKSLLSGLT